MTAQALRTRLEALAPGTPRYEVVAAAQKFKASWVDLAQHLTKVQASQAHVAWGYASFSAYCRDELCIRGETAGKLTRSYSYLRERAPAMLDEAAAAKQMPPLDVVDLLQKAKARTTVSAEAWDTLEGEVLAKADSTSRSAVKKRLLEACPEAFGPSKAAADLSAPKVVDVAVDVHNLRKVLLLAERLQALLMGMGQGMQQSVLKDAERLATALRGRMDAATASSAARGNDALPQGPQALGSAHLPPAAPIH